MLNIFSRQRSAINPKMNLSRAFIFLSACIFLAGCGSDPLDFSCKNEMDEVRAKLGAAQDVQEYRSGSYISTSWHYYRRGISYNFRYFEGCDVSTYTYTPIP